MSSGWVGGTSSRGRSSEAEAGAKSELESENGGMRVEGIGNVRRRWRKWRRREGVDEEVDEEKSCKNSLGEEIVKSASAS